MSSRGLDKLFILCYNTWKKDKSAVLFKPLKDGENNQQRRGK
jgi:hypothetical protein